MASSKLQDRTHKNQELIPHEGTSFKIGARERIMSLALSATTSYLALHYLQDPSLVKYGIAYIGSFGAVMGTLFAMNYRNYKQKITVTREANSMDWWAYRRRYGLLVSFLAVGSALEELLFRGPVVLTESFTAAWAFSAIFGALHAEGRHYWIKTAYTGFIGGLLSSIALTYGLGWAIGLHIAHNLFSLGMDLFIKSRNPLLNPYRLLEEFMYAYSGEHKEYIRDAVDYMLNTPDDRSLSRGLQVSLHCDPPQSNDLQGMKFYTEIPEQVKREYAILSRLFAYFPPKV